LNVKTFFRLSIVIAITILALTSNVSSQTWTDPATGLLWTTESKGYGMNWTQAKDYCAKLSLDGYMDWHLPTNDELAGVYDPTQFVEGCHIKGDITLHDSCMPWSSDTDGRGNFKLDRFVADSVQNGDKINTLCIRRFDRKTAELIRKAESGDVKAEYQLGVMFDRGEGVSINKAEAVRWYREAASQGDREAQTALQELSDKKAAEQKAIEQQAAERLAIEQQADAQKAAEQQADPHHCGPGGIWHSVPYSQPGSADNYCMPSPALQARVNEEAAKQRDAAARKLQKETPQAIELGMAEQRVVAKMSAPWSKSQCIRGLNNFYKQSDSRPPRLVELLNTIHSTTLALISVRLTGCGNYSWTYEERNLFNPPAPFKLLADGEQKWLTQTYNVRILDFIKQRGLLEKFAWEREGRGNTISFNDSIGFIKRYGLMAEFTKYDDLLVYGYQSSPGVDKHGIGLLLGVVE
jgi:hypothetical protein